MKRTADTVDHENKEGIGEIALCSVGIDRQYVLKMGQRDVGRDDDEEERVWVVVTGAAANDDSAFLCCRRLWLLRVCDKYHFNS